MTVSAAHSCSLVAPHVAIIVTCYRQPAFIYEALESALTQDVECGVIVVNDGCPYKESDNICSVLQSLHPKRLLYVRTRNGGPSSARNCGISLALKAWPTIEAVFFLDGDNRLGPMAVSRLLRVMRRTNADWVFTDRQIFSKDGPHFTIHSGVYFSALELIHQNYIDTGSLVSRRLLASGIRFDPGLSLLEDWDFWLTAVSQNFRGVFSSAAGLFYRHRPASLLRANCEHWSIIQRRIREKHRRWITPRFCVDLEHRESPRFARLVGSHAVLFTDPTYQERRMPREDFLSRLHSAAAARQSGPMPAYILAAASTVFEWLQREKLLHGVMWHLEATAFRYGAAALACNSEGGLEITGTDTEEALLVTVVRKDVFLNQHSRSRPPTRSLAFLGVVDIPRDISQEPISTEALNAAAGKGGRLYLTPPSHSSRINVPLAAANATLFRVPALFPIANRSVRIGFILPGYADLTNMSELSNQVTAAKSRGLQAYLFVDSTMSLPLTVRRCDFEAISVVTGFLSSQPSHTGGPAEWCGIVATMDYIVTIGLEQICPSIARLRQWGCKMLCALSFSPSRTTSEIAHEISRAVQYEYAVDAFLTDSKEVRQRLAAFGVPQDKLPSMYCSAFSDVVVRACAEGLERDAK